jgi:glycosyltransferase involved in cell wall biosynthesis
MMDDVKIRAIVDKPNSAYAHWRIVRPYTMLQSQGIDADWCWLDDKNTPLDNVDGAVIVLQRTILGTIKQALQFIEHLRSLKVKAIVYELDDDTLTQAYIRHMKMCGRILDSTIEKIKSEIAVQTILIQQCDAVTVSTLELKIIVEEVFNGPIYVVHNAIDVDWFTSKLQPLFDGKADGIVTIGWAGGLRPRYDLEPMAKAWGAIEKTHDNVRFVVAGWQPDVIYENVDMNKIVRLRGLI